MIDPETRAVLQATLEHLKTQMNYVRNLHESLVLLTHALKQELPEFERTERKVFETVVVGNSWQQSQIEQIDALLGELANPRT
jgi:hypothetical protein